MDNFNLKYFLAANSAEGFCSVFDKAYIADGEWRAFIIKGGPGTGKSSFMKYFAKKALDKKEKVVLCPCSSDPNSLDAVILPNKKIIIMDGTAPHTVDPSFPGVCEKILNFGEYWDESKFSDKKALIIEATLLNKAYHKSAARYIKAAGQLLTDNYKTALACTDKEKTLKFTEKLCRKLIVPKKYSNSFEWIRFIEGITPLGIVSYSNTILAEARNLVIINDEFGSASNIIMEKVRKHALACGYEIITVKNPFLPSVIIDHIIIPELSLAFVSENTYMHFKTEQRRIHSRRFVSQKKLHLSKERIKFNKKAAKQLFLSAAETLSKAKTSHDILEEYYINAMDFERLTAFAEDFTKELLN